MIFEDSPKGNRHNFIKNNSAKASIIRPFLAN